MSIFDRLKSFFGGAAEPAGAGTDCAEAGASSDMITCHDALKLVNEYLDGELAQVSESQVKAHFDVCQQCYPHLRLESVFRDTVRRAAGAQTAPPELRARVAQMLAEVESEG